MQFGSTMLSNLHLPYGSYPFPLPPLKAQTPIDWGHLSAFQSFPIFPIPPSFAFVHVGLLSSSPSFSSLWLNGAQRQPKGEGEVGQGPSLLGVILPLPPPKASTFSPQYSIDSIGRLNKNLGERRGGRGERGETRRKMDGQRGGRRIEDREWERPNFTGLFVGLSEKSERNKCTHRKHPKPPKRRKYIKE